MMESSSLIQNSDMNTGDRFTPSNKCKVALVGELGVGKTTLLERFANGPFKPFHISTTCGFKTKVLHIDDCDVELEIWETPGQERFRSVVPLYLKRSKAAVVTYDITKQKTFDKTRWWIEELRENADNRDLIIILVGNKADLDDKREVPTEKAAAYAKQEKIFFLEISAKENHNVDKVFLQIGKRFLNCSPEPVDKRDLVSLAIEEEESSKKCCC